MGNNLIKNNNIKEIKNNDNKKIDFLKKKDNTISSLFEVEHFLCNFKKILNTIKLFKILR